MTTKPLSSIEPLLTSQDAAGDLAVVRNRRVIPIRREDFERFLARHRHG